MLPSWRKRLFVSIGPERIGLVKLGRGWKMKVLASHEEAITPSGKQPSWQAMVDGLAQLLSHPEWQDAEVSIVLSNRLVRYATLLFGAQLQNYSAREGYARHCMTQIYGSAADQWELRIQHGKAGASSIVSAVDRALLEGLQQVCAEHKLVLRSVVPCLMPVSNHYRKAIESDPAWLVITEPGYSLLTLLKGGNFLAVNGVTHGSVDELPILLDRENLAGSCAEPCKSVYMYSSSGDKLSAMPATGYEFNNIDAAAPEGFPAFADGSYAAVGSPLKQPIKLDFQKPANPPRNTAGWALLAAGAALVIEMGMSYGSLQSDREAMGSEVRDSNVLIGRNEATDAQYTDKDFSDAREIINRLSTPWDSFFAGFESVKNKHVAILTIQPDIQTGLLQIQGEAKDYAAILTLIAQLRRTKPFSRVYLLHHEINRNDPQRPFNFTMSMRWMNPS